MTLAPRPPQNADDGADATSFAPDMPADRREQTKTPVPEPDKEPEKAAERPDRTALYLLGPTVYCA